MLAKKKEYDLLMFILSLYVLIEISIEFVVKFPSQLTLITSWIDNLICILFLIDWIYYLISAPKKRTYLFTHIFDLISSIPSVPGLRIFRFLRILRFLRGFKGIIKLWKLANKKPMESSLISYVVYMVTISFYCTLA